MSILEKGSMFFFGFGNIYLLTRTLEDYQFGVWVLFYTITSFFEVGRSGLLQNALVKYLSSCKPEDYNKITTASLTLNIILTSVCMLLLFFFANFISVYYNAPELASLLRIYCLIAGVLIIQQQSNFTLHANLNFNGIFWSNFVLKGSFFVVILYLYLSEQSVALITLATIQIGTAILASLVSLFFARPYLRFSRKIDRFWIKELFNYGRFTFGTNLSAMLYKLIDKLMLGRLAPGGAIAVGLYEWAIKITNLVEVPTFSIASVVFPKSAHKMTTEGPQAVKELYEKSVGAILAIVLPFMIFVFLFAEPIIVFLATEKFIESASILRITIWFGLFIPFAVQFGTILDSIGKPKINFRLTLVGFFLNIVMNYYFITSMGIIGAAYGTLSSYFLLFIAMQIILNRVIGVNTFMAFYHIFSFYKNAIAMVQDFVQGKKIQVKTENE